MAINYFKLIAKPNRQLLQGRVDTNVRDTRLRKAMFYQHQDILPKCIFDGTLMFTTTGLSPEDKLLILTRETRKETKFFNIVL